jgi:phosphoribosylformimino-5-aminoimidazole carboxamide ribotide isomerase
MLVIPAIDLKDGQCVRLLQGKKDKVTVYSHDPVATARQWVNQEGAERLHVVDLDGAFSGEQKNFHAIASIKKAVPVPVEVGGGIRDMETVHKLISIGVDSVIIGTVALEQPELFKAMCEKFPGRVIAGIDASEGKVAIKGWVEKTQRDALDFALEVEAVGAQAVIYTDIVRDGMLSGPNIDTTQRMAETLRIDVIASGGVSTIDDIKRLMTIKGLYGVITGKAIYSGSLNLKEAIELTKRNLFD